MALQAMAYSDEEVDDESNFCEICKIGFTSEQTFSNHKKGKVHEMKVAALKVVQEKKKEAKTMADQQSSKDGEDSGSKTDTAPNSDKAKTEEDQEEGEIEWQELDEWSSESVKHDQKDHNTKSIDQRNDGYGMESHEQQCDGDRGDGRIGVEKHDYNHESSERTRDQFQNKIDYGHGTRSPQVSRAQYQSNGSRHRNEQRGYGVGYRSEQGDHGTSVRNEQRDHGTEPRSQQRDHGTERRSQQRDHGTEPRSQQRDHGTEHRSQQRDHGTEHRSQQRDHGTEPSSQQRDYGTEPRSQQRDYGTEPRSQQRDYGTEPRSQQRDYETRPRNIQRDYGPGGRARDYGWQADSRDSHYLHERDAPARDRSPLTRSEPSHHRFHVSEASRDRFTAPDPSRDKFTVPDASRDKFDVPEAYGDRSTASHDRFDRYGQPQEFNRDNLDFNHYQGNSPSKNDYNRSREQFNEPGASGGSVFQDSVKDDPYMSSSYTGPQQDISSMSQTPGLFDRLSGSDSVLPSAVDPFKSLLAKPAHTQRKLPKQFYCNICDVQTTGEVTFNSHITGIKHAKKAKLKGLTQAPPVITEASGEVAANAEDLNIAGFELPTEARAQPMLDSHHGSALIGLQYVTEYVSGNAPAKYVCNMCECRCDVNALISHVTSSKHRINYMKENCMHYFTRLQQTRKMQGARKSDNSLLVEELAEELELEVGREQIKVKVDATHTSKEEVDKLLNLKRQVELAAELKAKEDKTVRLPPANAVRYTVNDALGKPPDEQSQILKAGLLQRSQELAQSEPSYADKPGYTEPNDPGSASGEDQDALGTVLSAAGSTGLAEMVRELSSCLVNNEEEAALALQVSNTLTQALLRYRLNQAMSS